MDGSLAQPLLNSDQSAARSWRVRFSKSCVRRGLALMAAGLSCVGLAVFLATQHIPYLDDGMKRADMFALLSCFLAVVLLLTGYRQVVSRMVVTATELCLEPDWCGFRVEWSEIREWSLEQHPKKRTIDLFLWLRLDSQPRRISSAWLEPTDFQHILGELQRHRGTVCRSPAAS